MHTYLNLDRKVRLVGNRLKHCLWRQRERQESGLLGFWGPSGLQARSKGDAEMGHPGSWASILDLDPRAPAGSASMALLGIDVAASSTHTYIHSTMGHVVAGLEACPFVRARPLALPDTDSERIENRGGSAHRERRPPRGGGGRSWSPVWGDLRTETAERGVKPASNGDDGDDDMGRRARACTKGVAVSSTQYVPSRWIH
jgi:hypothetical protein